MLVRLDGRLLHAGLKQRVVISKAKVISLRVKIKLKEMLFSKNVVGFEERLVECNPSQSEAAMML